MKAITIVPYTVQYDFQHSETKSARCMGPDPGWANLREKSGLPRTWLSVFTFSMAKDVNLIVATVNNAPAICMSIRDAAKGLIRMVESSMMAY